MIGKEVTAAYFHGPSDQSAEVLPGCGQEIAQGGAAEVDLRDHIAVVGRQAALVLLYVVPELAEWVPWVPWASVLGCPCFPPVCTQKGPETVSSFKAAFHGST